MSLRQLRHPRTSSGRAMVAGAAPLALILGMPIPPAAAANLDGFDGVYTVAIQQTMTISYAIPGMPPSASTTSVTSTMTVKDGVLLDSGIEVGHITNPNGSGLLQMPFPGLGDCIGSVKFTRAPSGVSRFTGQCELAGTIGTAVVTTVSQSLTGVGNDDSIRFTVAGALPVAHRGKPYPGASFCEPPVAPGGLCGGPLTARPTNPSGGPVNVAGGWSPYTFTIKSGFLPRGLVLNHRTGAITGTPAAGGRAGTYRFKVCAYTSIDNRNDACHWTSIRLV